MTTLEEYCASQTPFDPTGLQLSTRDFLEQLGLSSRHPFCSESNVLLNILESSSVPQQGPLLDTASLHDTWLDAAITWFWQYVPPYTAFVELWLRLLAGGIAPVVILYLVLPSSLMERSRSLAKCRRQATMNLCLLALVSSAIVMTDSN